MLLLLSPSKGMDHSPIELSWIDSKPVHLDISKKIATHFKKFSVDDFMSNMKVSEKLAIETHDLYKNWSTSKQANMIQSIFAYSGDVYGGLEARKLKKDELDFAQKHVRILSGLYGYLTPSDLILPYRLEIGYAHLIGNDIKLYPFWKPIITNSILNDLKKSKSNTILNLASSEYVKAIDKAKLNKYNWVDFDFLEEKNNQLKFISFNAKRGRGLMTRYIIQNKITNVDDIKYFALENYKLDYRDCLYIKTLDCNFHHLH
jgi:cytoplasmic iron level regulating protein YaaA (DUF328/UPF0246 family)